MKLHIVIIFLSLLLVGCETSKPLHVAPKDVRSSYVRQNPNIAPSIKRAIKGGRVIPGMSKEQVLHAWGEPYLRGVRRWEYRGWRNIYVLFENDQVKSVNFYSNM